ncbi:DUF2244 domain-containing protein [Stagnihabitans tardus]|uniref:DUF2244 domain-containing protein n=1 Tax=Stagnihabitans tardus TaxID=2699202 RepID=A0AAE4Y9V5_9RHOB|nr:DUF2244 domain-containing protein [Stagnihabitans tardus]NBZ86140.1 DUF2244 domain-containing protein [Stagnihabitans tardus]
MPYRWTDPETLTLWPHRSLGPRGFAWTMGLLSTGLSLPMATQLGHKTLWVILAFVAGTVSALWAAIRRNQSDRAIRETLILSRDSVTLTRQSRRLQSWEANPHWVRLTLYETGGPVPLYLTLSGNGREVEIGAFLTPEERRDLGADLARRLAALR